MLMMFFFDYGMLVSYFNMDGLGVYVFKFVDDEGNYKYVKFMWKVNQLIKNFIVEEVMKM